MKKHYVVEAYFSDFWFTGRFQFLIDACIYYNSLFDKRLSLLKSLSIYFVDDDGLKHPVEVEDMLDEVEQ